jgi:signal transduction histidine kinase
VREAAVRVGSSPIVGGLLELLGGWVAVLNDKRQVLTVNHALLRALGIERPDELLGLRPGEVLKCVHAHDHPGGCGTSRFCTTCGAAIAIVASLETHQAQQRECILTCRSEGQVLDKAFLVQAGLVQIDGENLVLICMRDVSDEKRRVALERTFLHDVSSLMAAVQIGLDVLKVDAGPDGTGLLEQIRGAAAEMIREVRVQKILAGGAKGSVEVEPVQPLNLLKQVCATIGRHPAGRGQSIEIVQPADEQPLETDPALLSRVLTNMLLNALEAGKEGDRIRAGVTGDASSVEFFVWNKAVIEPATAMRVFQQYFSTKPGAGRGLGTYSMKLLGEQILGGCTSFTSDPDAGTTFRLRLPRKFGCMLQS